ncbi:hypothetical protein EW146_g10293 [Bondarzewia mesenterica]|uniref:Uncharacterized protein n=1 Tax=Bondarzewia mesenterica TaxID=1095465 RepID=A0A4S4KZ66_9AGAM|nr:hypothetical protein EW146_g10293 [Bondarzewia mesenterica]
MTAALWRIPSESRDVDAHAHGRRAAAELALVLVCMLALTASEESVPHSLASVRAYRGRQRLDRCRSALWNLNGLGLVPFQPHAYPARLAIPLQPTPASDQRFTLLTSEEEEEEAVARTELGASSKVEQSMPTQSRHRCLSQAPLPHRHPLQPLFLHFHFHLLLLGDGINAHKSKPRFPFPTPEESEQGHHSPSHLLRPVSHPPHETKRDEHDPRPSPSPRAPASSPHRLLD